MLLRLHHHRRSILTGSAVLALAGAFAVAGVAVTVYRSFPGTGRPPADCAVVFGAAVYRAATPSPSLQRRVLTAARLYHEGALQRLFVTGGKGSVLQHSEAEVMEALALGMGVPASRITREDHARSTWENLLFTRPLTTSCMGVLAISDRYHLARIQLLARQQGWTTLRTFPADDTAPPRSELRSFLREVAAYMYYGLRLNDVMVSSVEPWRRVSPFDRAQGDASR